MDLTSVQLQYKGYFFTPLLWRNHTVLTLEQLDFPKEFKPLSLHRIPGNIVLGKRVEHFVYQEFDSCKNIQILKRNVQIQDQKITIGEIDCILTKDARPIHLEIVYKFYLYDPTRGNNELNMWVGPNKKDSLIEKLKKLKNKQLPLAHHPLTKNLFDEAKVDMEQMRQYVYFKAQLFVPFKSEPRKFKLLNKNCVQGFYVSLVELQQFDLCVFYIPVKADWLIDAHQNVEWMDYQQFYEKVNTHVEQKKSPMCWLKYPDGRLQKLFVVFW